jgi:FixJ family two-component response regulator
VRGNSNKATTNVLRLTVRTVKAHRHVVIEKMEVRTLVELVSLAERVNLLG